ncbi:DUF2891 family protein [Halobaculum rubrum]|uniref:DUF2891 family protein n=1 Tax=Halobaculum rubrum TaxID=2872158 RepID=UPI001CA46458|nr:DUF2891 family protein [Halobaculum rubrum]
MAARARPELDRWSDPWADRWSDPWADRWSDTLRPPEEQIRALVGGRFLPMERPHRLGTHGDSAFALSLIIDHRRLRKYEEKAPCFSGGMNPTSLPKYRPNYPNRCLTNSSPYQQPTEAACPPA